MEKELFIYTEKFTLVPAKGSLELAETALRALFEISPEEQIITLPALGGKLLFAYSTQSEPLAPSEPPVPAGPPVPSEPPVPSGSPVPAGPPQQALAYRVLELTAGLKEYNKLVVSIGEGFLYISLMVGEKLITLNAHKVQDFNTALYYMLATLKESQVNPSQTKVHIFRTQLEYNQLERLGRYFKRAEIL